MAEGGIEIVAPEQADDAAAEPDAFRIAGRPGQGVLGFGKFVDLLRLFAGSWPLRGGLVGGFGVVGLGEGGRTRGDRGREQATARRKVRRQR